MKVLFVGDLDPGGTCFQRLNVLRELGHEAAVVDTYAPLSWWYPWSPARVMRKLGRYPDFTGANGKVLAMTSVEKFDLIWVEKGIFLRPGTLAAVRASSPSCRIVSYSPDDMMNPDNSSAFYRRSLPLYDLHVTTKSYNETELLTLGARRTLFVFNAYDRHTHRPMDLGEAEREYWQADAGFIGGFESDRCRQLLALAEAGVSVTVRCNGWERAVGLHRNLKVVLGFVVGPDYARAICATKVNLGFLRKVNRDLQTQRSAEIPACGGFMLAERTDEHLAMFREGVEAEFFGDTAELIEKTRYYLAHDDERARVGRNGRARCLREGYSYHEQIGAVLEAAFTDAAGHRPPRQLEPNNKAGSRACGGGNGSMSTSEGPPSPPSSSHANEGRTRPRVAIVVSHPIQHFVPFYRALTADGSVALRVFFASKFALTPSLDEGFGRMVRWDTELLGGYDHAFLDGADAVTRISPRTVNNPGVGKSLAAFAPDVVMVYGYSQVTPLKALVWAVRNDIPVLMQSDSELLHHRPLPVRMAKEAVLRPLLGLVSGFLVVGDHNEAYLRHYGVPPSQFFRSPLSADDEAFAKARAERPRLRAEIRSRHGIPEDAVLALFVGKLIPRKRPTDLLLAVQRLQSRPEQSRPIYALFAGDGVLRGSMEDQDERVSPSRCRFAGFVNQTMLPAHYAAADLLVHPSEHDPHPLTVTEAGLMGLPVVVSDKLGCVGPRDSARTGRNAVVYPVGDLDALASALVRIAGDDDFAREMSEASLSIADELGMRASVGGFLEAVDSVARARSARRGPRTGLMR